MLAQDISEFLFFSGLINLVIWLIVSIYSIGILRCPIYHPVFIFLIYHFLGFVVRPFSIYLNQGSFLWKRIGFSPDALDMALITLVSNIALLSVFAGFVLFGSVRKKIKKLEPTQLSINRPFYFYIALVGLSVAGFYATWLSLAGAGLEQVLAYSTEVDSAGGQRLVDVSGYQTALAEFLPIICIFLYFSERTRKFSYIFIALFVAIRFYAGAQRLSFIVVLAAIFLFFHVAKGLRYPKIAPVFLILIFAIGFDVIGNDRYSLRRILDGTASLSQIFESYIDNRGSNLFTSDIVEYDVAAAAVSFVANNSDYTYGTQFLRLLIWPIPRQIWNDKPIYTSIVDLNKYGDFRYLTTTVYADSFMILSFPSLIVMMFALGAAMSILYKKASSTENVLIYMFFWVFLIYLKTILRDGGVTVFYFWIFSMIAVIILTLAGKVEICRKK